MSINVAVSGAGSWGTTVAHICARNVPTTLWARRPEVAAEATEAHTNATYLPGFDLDPALRSTASLEEAVVGADLLVLGVPSNGMRATAPELAPWLRPWVPGARLSKGREQAIGRASCWERIVHVGSIGVVGGQVK